LQLCCSSVAALLQLCCSSVAALLQLCCRGGLPPRWCKRRRAGILISDALLQLCCRRRTGILMSYPSSACDCLCRSSVAASSVAGLLQLCCSSVAAILRLHATASPSSSSKLLAIQLTYAHACVDVCRRHFFSNAGVDWLNMLSAQHSLTLQALFSSVSLSRYAETRDIAMLKQVISLTSTLC